MVVDSSGLFAIAFGEPERLTFLESILSARNASMSAPTLVECRLVALRRAGADWDHRARSLIEQLDIRIVAFDEPQAILAADAFRRYGKGRHEAALNFGDCFSYALSKTLSEPLLFKGQDFAKTDVVSAL